MAIFAHIRKISLPNYLLVGAVAFQLIVASPANAELDEVVVTAQKREQSLQDVPLSVSATTGATIEKNNMAQIEDFAILVPNFNIGDSPGEHTINIRGIGSATSNRAFEQSVGLYVDGVYTGRPQQFLAPFLDVERVEVVRGPQGVLFGKNSNAGAVSITTARPADEFSAKIRANYDTEYQGWGLEGVLNVPISDKLSTRFAVLSNEQGSYMQNSAGADGSEKTLDAFRASLLWSPSDTLDVYLKAEHSEVDWIGTNFQVLNFGSGPAEGFYLSKDPNAEDSFDLRQQTDGNFIAGKDTTNGNDSNTYALQADWALAGSTLTYIAAYSEYDSTLGIDTDFGAFPATYSEGGDDFSQTSHELRITSNGDRAFEYIAGLFYLDRNYRIPDWQFHANFPELPPPLPPFTRNRNYDEDTKTLSAFAQGTYNFSDSLSVSLGLRYVDESKDADSLQYTSAMGDPSMPIPGGIPVFPNYEFSGSRDENSTTPSVNVQWSVSDDVMLYASYNEAEKSGGFNSNSAIPAGIEYETEKAAGYEIGAKMISSGGTLRMNVALFSTKFDDYQVSSFDGVTQTVNNAATTISRGAELEVDWAAGNNLTIGGSLAYLDAYYDDFPNAPCAPLNQADCVNGDFRDATGEQITYAPRYSGSVYGDLSQPVGSNLEFNFRLTGSFSDDYFTQIDKSPETKADSYFILNARAGLGGQDGKWELAIVGTNLTDERIFNFAGNLPFFPGAFFANTKAPRLVSLEANLRF
jgi:outer membrane receptor protein involved in Fe transport